MANALMRVRSAIAGAAQSVHRGIERILEITIAATMQQIYRDALGDVDTD